MYRIDPCTLEWYSYMESSLLLFFHRSLTRKYQCVYFLVNPGCVRLPGTGHTCAGVPHFPLQGNIEYKINCIYISVMLLTIYDIKRWVHNYFWYLCGLWRNICYIYFAYMFYLYSIPLIGLYVSFSYGDDIETTYILYHL